MAEPGFELETVTLNLYFLRPAHKEIMWQGSDGAVIPV